MRKVSVVGVAPRTLCRGHDRARSSGWPGPRAVWRNTLDVTSCRSRLYISQSESLACIAFLLPDVMPRWLMHMEMFEMRVPYVERRDPPQAQHEALCHLPWHGAADGTSRSSPASRPHRRARRAGVHAF